ncbi:hypothetical protein BST11_07480 [Mycobacterium alsense]|uniref:Uncharacterized protein n=1 Tax=Mycobacterium alsense TaxID=324058 RepID=A0AA41XMD9_9MYCO|nr:hypothetical protein [Mycobacterium alsense]MCV7378901.1 hypothetical protein [Mycobacterium alsense]OQZ91718.1 hypothetical protein BST11_07480 [Mycobacterium alsense]
MAERLDVAGRLAEGRAAVEHTETYVRACHLLGYQHPDLTAHPGQIRDWYDSEDGLDLRVLDRDCGELRAAGAAVLEALRMQRDGLAELTAAWQGPGGDAALGFLERHCDAANTVASEVRAAAQRCESLRDNLWYLVDSKVATAIAIDERTRAQRPDWLAAATAVTTGVGDRSGADEVIRQHVIPYVDNEIRDDWLTTMRSTVDGVDTAYAMVTDRMAAAPAAGFEVPGDLGPGHRPLAPGTTTPPEPASPAGVAAAPADPVSAPAAPTPAEPAPAVPPTPPAALPAPPLPDLGTAAAPDLGTAAAMPVGGAGLGSLVSRIVDAMGSLLGSGAEPLGGEDALDNEEPFHPDHEDKPDGPDQAKDVDAHPDAAAVTPVEEAEPGGPPPPADGPPAPVAAPAPVDGAPAPVAAPPGPGPAGPATDPSTPCEIAADQLPQAGQ